MNPQEGKINWKPSPPFLQTCRDGNVSFRDDFPWLYEILVEVYREVRDGDAKAAQKAIERLRRITRAMGHHPFMDEIMMGARDKESHIIMMELPMMLDHFLHRFERRQLKGSLESDANESETPAE